MYLLRPALNPDPPVSVSQLLCLSVWSVSQTSVSMSRLLAFIVFKYSLSGVNSYH